MDKETFISRLNEACSSALKLARESTFNEITDNLIYTIKPNSFDLSDHLTDLEKENLSNRKKELNKTLTGNEVTDRLILDKKAPAWINCSVIGTSKGKTIIELLTSRRFRNENELYHQKEGYSPFHALIQLPPYLSMDLKEKFDINWRRKKIQTKIRMLKAKRTVK